jgi:hypothetical protein
LIEINLLLCNLEDQNQLNNFLCNFGTARSRHAFTYTFPSLAKWGFLSVAGGVLIEGDIKEMHTEMESFLRDREYKTHQCLQKGFERALRGLWEGFGEQIGSRQAEFMRKPSQAATGAAL